MHRTTTAAIAAATALAMLSTATLATAADGGVPDCPPAEEQEFEQTLNTAGGVYYLNAEDEDPSKLGLWRELNTWPGLQTEDGSCNSFGEIKNYSADIHVKSPSDTGLV